MSCQKFITEKMSKLDNHVCFPVYALSRRIINKYRPFLDELGITYPQYLVLMVLMDDEPRTVNQLGEKLHLDSGTLTPLLKRMEMKNLISRCRKSCDERVVEINLTDSGKSLWTKASVIPQKVMESFPVTEEELLELKQIVVKILDKTNHP